MKFYRAILLGFCALGFFVSSVGAISWVNPAGGNWNVNTNWSPATVPGVNDIANIVLDGNYTVSITSTITVGLLKIGAANGTQTLVIDNGATVTCTNGITLTNSSILVLTNGGMVGNLIVESNAQFQLVGPSTKFLYSLNLTNRGTINWTEGSFYVGSAPPNSISNGGTFQITGGNSINFGGGTAPYFINSGIVRKTLSNTVSAFAGPNFINKPGGLVETLTGTLQLSGGITNELGGTFTTTAPGLLDLLSGTWYDAGGVTGGTGTNQFRGTTLNLRTNLIPNLKLINGDVYVIGTNTFQQAGVITNMTLNGATLRGTNWVNNGILTLAGTSSMERVTVQSAGHLLLAPAGTLNLYSATLINQGTVTLTNGSVNVGKTTVISNGGLWDVAGDNANMNYGDSGFVTIFTNAGILRKTSGTGTSYFTKINFLNLPGALVDCVAGKFQLDCNTSNVLGGTMNATLPGLLEITSGVWTDAGGVAIGTGTNRFNAPAGTFNFRTNSIPGLKWVAGSLYITGTNTFQQNGAITNLTLDGASLFVTNFIPSGALTVNSGSVSGQLIIKPGGQLALPTAGVKNLSLLNLVNQDTVNWTGGDITGGSTVVSNGGLWQMTSDNSFNLGSGAAPIFTNSGIVRKTAGTGTSQLSAVNFYNQSAGLVQVDTGTLQLNTTSTNQAGALRVNGGTLNANGTLKMNGGTLDGVGFVGANALTGGTISPGVNGPGLITFTSGLNLGSNATLSIDGTGTVPGTQYDQLSVLGSVSLGNAALKITSLPNVAVGAAFVIITNDASEAVTGTFGGLAENGATGGGGQPFRVHYAAGSGNDVTLVRDVIVAPTLSSGHAITNGVWSFSGIGSPSSIYAVQATTNLINWTNIGFATGAANGGFIFSDSNAYLYNRRFYRTTN